MPTQSADTTTTPSDPTTQTLDVVVIGAGIVGLATAYRLQQRYPDKRIVVLEKEASVAKHQTGHNSGVLHSGIYYKPGSLKAENCRTGKAAMEAFCEEHDIDYEICGKVIVALDDSQLAAMNNIYERGQQNGVSCEVIGRERLVEIEPHSAGIAAIHVPEAGIVNYGQVCEQLATEIRKHGGQIVFGARVTGFRDTEDEKVVLSTAGDYAARLIVNCAGLYCDRVTRLSGTTPEAKIVPFRGEYYELKPEKHHLCKHLIYPVPDPSFPFLGVHFTRMIEGGIECGPNAVLAFAREGYTKSAIHLGELLESLTYSGFLRLALKYWRTGCGEMWRSFSKRAFVRALQALMPEIDAADLEPAPAGVRAQALTPQGALVDDFLIQDSERVVNVGNAPSPGATASLNIGNVIVDRLATRWTS
ncbi:MAG: L-2-hydroxyglutarate oxidase [Planctomycetota bacterium]